jgi:hypothetical protein
MEPDDRRHFVTYRDPERDIPSQLTAGRTDDRTGPAAGLGGTGRAGYADGHPARARRSAGQIPDLLYQPDAVGVRAGQRRDIQCRDAGLPHCRYPLCHQRPRPDQ